MRILAPASWSLRTKIIVLLVIASVLPLAVSAYSDIEEAREQLISTMSGVLDARSDQLAQQIDALTNRYALSAAKFARLPEIMRHCSRPQASDEIALTAQAALIAQPVEDPHVQAAAVLNLRGVVTIATDQQLVGLDLSYRPHVRRALTGVPVISEVHVEGAGANEWPAIAFLHPIRGLDGTPIGVLSLWLRASALWNVTRKANGLAGPGSIAALLDGDGIRIAHTSRDDLVFRPAGTLERPTLERLIGQRRFGSATEALLNDVHVFPKAYEDARAPRASSGTFLSFSPGNSQMNYLVARRLESVPWTLFFFLPKAVIDAQIAVLMRERIALAAAMTLVAIMVSMLLAKIVLQPVQFLSEATARLSAGDLSARIAAPTGNDELGKLMASFNAMASRIETQARDLVEARDQLEHRVADRTAELTHTARLLEDEVADRRRAETELVKSQARFSALADAGVIGLITLDLEGHTIDANEASLSIIGYSREEVMALDFSWANLTPADWKPHDDLARVQLFSEGVVRPREKEYVHKLGHRIPVLTGATLLKADNQLVAFVLDLSERRRAEATLTRLRQTEASEAKFRGLLEAAPDAVVIIKADGKIAIVNAQAEEMFGYTRQQLIGQPVELLIPQRFTEAHIRHRSDYFREPKARSMGVGLELLGVRRDGIEFPIEISLSPMHMTEGLLVSAAIRDVTDRKRAADALARAKEETEAANRELEAFSYSVAHDLRAPLRGMNGFAHILLDSYRDRLDADGQDWLHEIVLNAEKMGTLIDALLSLARVTRSELRLQTVDLSSIAREVASQLATTAPERKVDWAIADNVLADADPVLARAVLENLITNAWKFSARNVEMPRIELGSTEREGERIFYVRDNGAGFDMSYAKKLFAPFQRLHTSEEFPGTGIGLATVQRIVQRHGGRVWAEGAVNRGATFSFTFSTRMGPI